MDGLEHKMSKRYNNRATFRNGNPLYDKVLEEKDRLYINQYNTPRFPEITAKMKTRLTRQKYIWKTGDTYQRLAEAFYIGDTIVIPKPLDTILQFFGV